MSDDDVADATLTGAGYGHDRRGGDDSGTCYCAGDHADWDHHHPSGCAKTLNVFKTASGVDPEDADIWAEAHVDGEPVSGESHDD